MTGPAVIVSTEKERKFIDYYFAISLDETFTFTLELNQQLTKRFLYFYQSNCFVGKKRKINYFKLKMQINSKINPGIDLKLEKYQIFI